IRSSPRAYGAPRDGRWSRRSRQMDMAGNVEVRWALIVHGGAKEMKPGEEDDNRAGVIEAANAGAEVLRRGGSAVDAVEASIRVLERLPVFNAGCGSVLNDLK